LLFDRDIKTIGKHINNVFKEGELLENSVVAKFATTASDGKTYQVDFYNLDVIISVGYRVKSKEGTQFRQWANSILKDYLVKGYAINEKRLQQKEQEVKILKQGIQILNRVIEDKAGENNWLSVFANGLQLLDDYDHENLDTKGKTNTKAIYPSLQDYNAVINQMQSDFQSEVFGKAKDKSFESALAQIQKGFDNKDFYESIEEKAAMLLYLVVKNHAFVDGNKRIAAACFLKFLQANNILFNANNETIISNDTLASLTLFIATSKPEEIGTVKKIIISVLNRN
jgi:death-on-curing family protein